MIKGVILCGVWSIQKDGINGRKISGESRERFQKALFIDVKKLSFEIIDISG